MFDEKTNYLLILRNFRQKTCRNKKFFARIEDFAFTTCKKM